MSRITWDDIGEKTYETGVKKGVLYPMVSGSYTAGVPWNGLTAVNENPTGAETTAKYADDTKYLNLVSSEEYAATIEAFTYPDEFAQCDGSATAGTGGCVSIGQQKRKPFGFSYVTTVGNDTDEMDYGYKIHLVYNALAKPSSKSYGTVNETPDAITFSWEISTTPVEVGSGYKPTAHLVIDSTKTTEALLTSFKDIIYGSENAEPRLPLPSEVISHFTSQETTTP